MLEVYRKLYREVWDSEKGARGGVIAVKKGGVIAVRKKRRK